MHLACYTYFTKDYQAYEFYSEGPKGKIKKLIQFTKIQDKPVIYNLAFGDEDLGTGSMSDSIVTNNNDRDKVLITVANTIIDFSNAYENPYIRIKGSSLSRTRLYQIAISNMWEEVRVIFDVYGLKNRVLHKFQKGVNYESFLIKKK